MNEASFKMTTFSCPKCDFVIQVCRCKIYVGLNISDFKDLYFNIFFVRVLRNKNVDIKFSAHGAFLK
jgi:hypothetical protein